jgi:putative glutamine amidotransferase
MERRPLIGVIPIWDETKDSLWMLPGYFDGILAAGGLPVMLPLKGDKPVIEQCAQTFDGFLFTGGHDVSPALYGEAKLPVCDEVCAPRDEMETLLFEKAVLERDKPAFGICRGIQFFNAVLGGTLYQDLPTQKGVSHAQKPPYDTPHHAVDIVRDTPLFELIGAATLEVNSCHHQAVKTLSSKLNRMAVADGGIVEAAYMPDRTFAWAVQWHPELRLDDPASKKLFGRFIEACLGPRITRP